MSNTVKYSVTAVSQSLKKNDFWIGTGDVNKGPTSSSGFYTAIAPVSGGYAIYLNKASQGPSIYTASSDSELITLTNRISGLSFANISQCLLWYRGQSDKMVFNREFDPIITDGLFLASDANFSSSYPATGATWYDLGPSGYNGILTNGPIYSNNSLFFDSTDDYVAFTSAPTYPIWSVNLWTKANLTASNVSGQVIFNIFPTGATPINSNQGTLAFDMAAYYNVNSIAVGPTGGIYVGGQFAGAQDVTRSTIVKFNSNGTIDTNFNVGYTPTSILNSSFEAFTFDSSGDLYISGTNLDNMGSRKINPVSGAFISRPLTGSGGVSPTITSGGILLDESAGKLWMYGHWATSYNGTSRQHITKVNISGYTLDTTFDSSTGFNNNEVYSAFLDASKNLYLAGNFTQYKSTTASRIVKLNGITAAIDTSFATGTGFNAIVNKIALTSGGKILAAGNFTSYNGTSINRVVQLNTDGTIDSSFSVGTGFNANVLSFDIQSDNKIVFVGSFTSYNGTTSNRIIRLNTDGSIDGTFTIGTGFSTAAQTVKIQSDGKILVGVSANFSYNSAISTTGLIRLNSDGVVDVTFNIGSGINLGVYRDAISGRIASGVFQSIGVGSLSPYLRVPATSIFPLFNMYRMYTITFDSSRNIRVYLDGVLKVTTATTGSASMNMQITSFYPPGYPGQLALYNRNLSATEILQNYQNSFARYLGINIVTSNLFLYLDAAYANSYQSVPNPTNWYDISGNNRNGTLINGPTGSTEGGGSIVFDGTNDYASISSLGFNTSPSGSFSIEIVFKRNTATPVNFDTIYLLGGGSSITDSRIWLIMDNNDNGQLALNYASGTGFDYYITLTNSHFDTLFHHVVQVVDKSTSTMTGYYDGVAVGTSAIRPLSTTASSAFTICGTNYADATVGYIRIYDRALTYSEVNQNFQAVVPRFFTVITSGLVWYVDAGNPASYVSPSTTWFDIGPSGYNGTLTNGPTYSSLDGGSIVFDGTNDYADFGNVLASLTNLTLECWVKCDSQVRNFNGILSKTASNSDGWEIRTASGFTATTTEIQFRYVGDLATTAVFTATNGIWYHFVATGQFGAQRFYVNGNQTGSQAFNINTTVNTQPLSIGKLAYSPRYFKGNVAIARIYNRVLSAAEVTQNFNAQKARFGY